MSRVHGCVGPALRGATTWRIAVGPQAGGVKPASQANKSPFIRGFELEPAPRVKRHLSPDFNRPVPLPMADTHRSGC